MFVAVDNEFMVDVAENIMGTVNYMLTDWTDGLPVKAPEPYNQNIENKFNWVKLRSPGWQIDNKNVKQSSINNHIL